VNKIEKDLHLTTVSEGALFNGLLKLAKMYKHPQWRCNEEW
jgi:hypothetical protein